MRAAPNLLHEVLLDHQLMVVLHSSTPPREAEWNAWLSATDALWREVERFRLLVVSEGGHPNREQLTRLEQLKRRHQRMGGRQRSEPITAIVSNSVAMRFAVASANLFNPRARCFPPSALAGAYRHLGLSLVGTRAAEAVLGRLRSELHADSEVA